MDEPGLYGVVRDRYGFDWFRKTIGYRWDWLCSEDGSEANWDHIPEPQLVRAGIEHDVAKARLDSMDALIAAVCEAYDNEGVGIWWNSWLRADEERKRRMAHGVMVEWSGNPT